MKKKTVVFLSVICLALFFAFGSIYANIIPWNIFEKEKGVIRVKDGVVFERPDLNQALQIIESINPVTGKSGFMARNEAEGLQRKSIELNHRKGKTSLEFNFVNKDGRNVFLSLPDHEPGAGYQLTTLPDSNNVIVEYEGILYLADVENNKITELLYDQVDGYSLDQAIKQSQEIRDDGNDPFIWWGSRPSVNPSASKMVFYTNRSGENEIWIKDLVSGDEKPFMKSAMTVSTWINDEEFIASESFEIIRVNTSTGSIKPYGKATIFDVTHTHLVMQQDSKTLDFYNLKNNERKTYESESLNHVSAIATIPDSAWVAVINQPILEKPKTELYLINANDHKTKILDIPDSKEALTIQWKDSNILYLMVRDIDTSQEETAIIDINKL